MVFWLILCCFLAGLSGGILGALFVEAYQQRRATELVGDYDYSDYQEGPRHAG
jgi:hypothetical protein